MGLVPGHAKRKRNLADAKRNRQEAKLLKQDRLARRDEADQAKPWWQQRTAALSPPLSATTGTADPPLAGRSRRGRI
jgi:hypothetical protein